MTNFPSRIQYEKRINDFLNFHRINDFDDNDEDLLSSLVDYIDEAMKRKKVDGSFLYGATCLRTWISIFKKFWKFTCRGNLDLINPNFQDDLKKLERFRSHVIKKAKCFKKEEIKLYLCQPNTIDNLWKKVKVIVGIHLAGRSGDFIDV